MFNEEAFELYKKYNYAVHDKDEVTPQSYKNFLCNPVLEVKIVNSTIDPEVIMIKGSVHMNYYLDE